MGLGTRIGVTLVILIPATFLYWDALLESVHGSVWKAGLIVGLAVAAGITDMNGMSGQPHVDDDHDH
jgi:hypothetical protein|eukprot:CAMPEP_0198282390 /NCGR_PEP_ID=MMETSP1449-20131203/2234_1 /TAXON_ID=420275 /ORGANISM="Attheya septentrionalis, Strain CCMP2084" /LENGTH=66 /DNA_ID=CAMNT_0043978643 /DNA_START=212 /DNA_END=412 /DNA_ORIENTATION=-